MTHNVRNLCKCGISIPSSRDRCLAFAEGKDLELMFGDFGQAKTKAWIFINADFFLSGVFAILYFN